MTRPLKHSVLERKPRVKNGFTLVELIITLLLISILAISFGRILNISVYSYLDATDRNSNTQTARWVVETISRKLREALPQSVRRADNSVQYCVEFLPIVNASYYFNMPANGQVSSFNIVDFDISFQSNLLVAVMPINSNQLYSANGVIADVASIANSGVGQSLVTLSSPVVFNQRSPQNRVYLLLSPESFCLDNSNGQLSHYSNYPLTSNQSTPPTGGISQIIAERIWQAGNVFDYQAGSLQRSGLLQMEFRLQNANRNSDPNAEALRIFHEVHIRNVP